MPYLSSAEETTLALKAKENSEAFSELYNCYFNRIYNYVHYRVTDSYAADDIISEIFEKVLSRLDYYQAGRASFSTWLFTIARNTITDYYRSKNRISYFSLEETEELVDMRLNPADIVALNDTHKHLLRALSILSYREQEIIALKFWSGHTNREIAKIISISESNAGIILFRAMRRLRQALEEQGIKIYE